MNDDLKNSTDRWRKSATLYAAVYARLDADTQALAGDLLAFGKEIIRPTPKILNGASSMMDGMTEILDWMVDRVKVTHDYVHLAIQSAKANADQAGAGQWEEVIDFGKADVTVGE